MTKQEKKMVNKKTYNPFKLLGSWIGLIVGTIIALYGFYSPLFGYDYEITLFFIFKFPAFVGIINLMVICFFIGYTIHLIIRLLKYLGGKFFSSQS